MTQTGWSVASSSVGKDLFVNYHHWQCVIKEHKYIQYLCTYDLGILFTDAGLNLHGKSDTYYHKHPETFFCASSWKLLNSVMDILLADVNNLQFKAERDLIEQIGAIPLPFYGMDKSIAAVCNFIAKNGQDGCDKGTACPFRHIRGDRTIVCKHWLRGLCKKGDQCEFLHEYDMTKMPECYFYSRFNACHNKECPFLHIDPQSKVKDCPWYKRGFCRHGPHCRHQHLRRVLCMNYLAGFCPEGPNCKHMHPRFELPPLPDVSKEQIHKKLPTCHYCGELGHKANSCKQYVGSLENRVNITLDPHSENPERDENSLNLSQHFVKVPTPIEEVTCYKCGHKGHYANKCPKGHLAFLSNQHSHK